MVVFTFHKIYLATAQAAAGEKPITAHIRSPCRCHTKYIIPQITLRVNTFFEKTKGFEDAPEGGERCTVCFELRLCHTIKKALDMGGFDYVATTLTVSPHKNAPLINEIGERLTKDKSIAWLPSDFKKKNGYLRSIQLSKQHDIYRQDYCGCIYSKKSKEDLNEKEYI